MKKKIGILGGTFDPPHKGHLGISKLSIKKLNLDYVIWAITKKNPFKKKPLIDLKKRIFLSKKLIKNNQRIKIKSYDNIIKSSQTINLINYFKNKNKKTEFFFLMGSDNLIHLHKWKNWRKITKKCRIIVFPRKGYVNKSLKSIAFRSIDGKNLLLLKTKMYNISSSKLRKSYLKYI
tara:strand:- start:4976 stop:5506 length:531 start_codon:yes stop_codon:yes gene_type:complete